MKSLGVVLSVFMLAPVVLTGCFFTGVESTQALSEKEVSRTISELERRQPTMTLTPYLDSVPAWRVGKEFYVTDNQVCHLFSNQLADSVELLGQIIVYDGYESGSVLDNRDCLNLRFRTASGMTLVYRTDKTAEQFTSKYGIPLLIDMDMVRDIDRQLRGKEVYIKTPLWYSADREQMYHARQFVKVRFDRVEPGNKVLPLKVCFTALDDGTAAFVWMSDPNAAMHNRDFDSMFSLRDLHESYAEIDDATWQLIVNGDVAVGMTKEACRLSFGPPRRVNRLPDQTGLREYWYYDGGRYLFFVDGLLNQYRK